FADLLECLLGLFDRLGHRHDAVETGGTQRAHQAGAVADHDDVTPELPGAANAPDQRPQAGRVDERHAAHVDDELRARSELRQRLAELAHGEGVELTDGTADGVTISRLLLLDVEHVTSQGLRPALRSRANYCRQRIFWRCYPLMRRGTLGWCPSCSSPQTRRSSSRKSAR